MLNICNDVNGVRCRKHHVAGLVVGHTVEFIPCPAPTKLLREDRPIWRATCAFPSVRCWRSNPACRFGRTWESAASGRGTRVDRAVDRVGRRSPGDAESLQLPAAPGVPLLLRRRRGGDAAPRVDAMTPRRLMRRAFTYWPATMPAPVAANIAVKARPSTPKALL